MNVGLFNAQNSTQGLRKISKSPLGAALQKVRPYAFISACPGQSFQRFQVPTPESAHRAQIQPGLILWSSLDSGCKNKKAAAVVLEKDCSSWHTEKVPATARLNIFLSFFVW